MGTWRGFEVRRYGKPDDWNVGEMDLIFDKNTLTLVYPNATRESYNVATTGGGTFILEKDNVTTSYANNDLAYLRHTRVMGLSTFGPGQPAPASFKAGMVSNKALAEVLWRCKAGAAGADCSFNNTVSAPRDVDSCNKYKDCHGCISSEGALKCGWCLGGTLSYPGVGKTTFKCGGYKDGSPHDFTCPADFRTTDCSGFACDWTAKTCTKVDNGEFPTLKACNDTCSISDHYKKCDYGTKKCVPCKMGDEGCNTEDFCNATCNVPHAKCDFDTGVCGSCDPATDPACTTTAGNCKTACKK